MWDNRKVEREKTGDDVIEKEQIDYLKTDETKSTASSYLGYTVQRTSVETINLVDSKEVPNDAALIGDVSEKQNGSIMI